MEKALGARSVNAFTHANYLDEIPLVSTLPYEGLFNENYFQLQSESNKLSEIEVSQAQVINPITGRLEQWLGLLTKSKYDGIGLREPIDIIVSLDISGSMGNSMNSGRGMTKSRFELAKIGIFKLIDLLEPNDGFGLTIFEMTATRIIPLISASLLGDKEKQMITNIKKQGGTNLLKGLTCAYETMKASSNDERCKGLSLLLI